MATSKIGGRIEADVVRLQSAYDRITVALIPQASARLQSLQIQTNLSKTDIVNRAITLYEFIDGQHRNGRELLVRDPRTKQTELVRILF